MARADRRLARWTDESRRLTYVRLALFVLFAVAAVTCFKLEWYGLGNGLVGAGLLLFIVVAAYHNRLEQRMHRWRLWQGIKRTHLARLARDWDRLPPQGNDSAVDHAYARDLDIVGPRSLLRLVDTTQSTGGRDRLRTWLLTQGQNATYGAARQHLVRELTPLARLRDRLALESARVDATHIDGARIRAALTTPAGWPTLPRTLWVMCLLAATTFFLFAAKLSGIPSLMQGIGDTYLTTFTLYALLFLWTDRSDHSFEQALSLQDELERFGSVLTVLERQAPTTGRAGDLCRPLRQVDRKPSRLIRRAARIASGLSVRTHPIVHILANIPLPWDLLFTYRLMRLQTEVGAIVPVWIEALNEWEAASALATFAWLHPDYAWPTETNSATTDAVRIGITARQLGHPLIDATTRVPNDVTLSDSTRMMLVTGSNMSGKSTFLRTIGLNVCLAQAGAPVCASQMTWTWCRLQTCMRIADSLDAGLSHFYAEVKRLRAVLEAAQEQHGPPVLFLIDEIYRGTNNRERLIGSRAYVLALSRTGAMGLVTTHDLELAELAEAVPHLANVHFEERVVEGRLHFDYRLKPGPCPTTNALRIMELEGLPTDSPSHS